MTRAVGYVRRSAKSEDNTVSLAEQARQITEYCRVRSFDLAYVVSHNGVSGAKRSRWEDILEALRNSVATVLVIYSLDRLSRDMVGLMDNLRRLESRGIAVHETSSGVVNITKSASKLTVAVRGIMDEFFRDVVAEKTKDALAYKKNAGLRYTHIPPFGYRYDGNKIVFDPVEQGVLVMVEEWRRAGVRARAARRALLKSGYNGRCSVSLLHKLISQSTDVSGELSLKNDCLKIGQ